MALQAGFWIALAHDPCADHDETLIPKGKWFLDKVTV